MLNRNLILAKNKLSAAWYRAKPIAQRWLPRAGFLILLWIVLAKQHFSFQISFGTPRNDTVSPSHAPQPLPTKTNSLNDDGKFTEIPNAQLVKSTLPTPESASILNLNLANPATAVSSALTPEQQKAAEKFSNLGFALNPDYATKHGVDPAIVAYKKQKCALYIYQFLKTAKEEAELFGIPVSITLAQGLLESNAGDSRLAKNDNNHFGIKCTSKCIGCRCANYTDDSKFDMFRVFESGWRSFREHSKLLTGARYKHLLKLPRSDYRNWAHGLQAAGYATDNSYANKLIAIIEAFQLHLHD